MKLSEFLTYKFNTTAIGGENFNYKVSVPELIKQFHLTFTKIKNNLFKDG